MKWLIFFLILSNCQSVNFRNEKWCLGSKIWIALIYDTQDKNHTLKESFFCKLLLVLFLVIVLLKFASNLNICLESLHLFNLFIWLTWINEWDFHASLHWIDHESESNSVFTPKYSSRTIFWFRVYKLAVNYVSLKIIFLAQRIDCNLLNCHYVNLRSKFQILSEVANFLTLKFLTSVIIFSLNLLRNR